MLNLWREDITIKPTIKLDSKDINKFENNKMIKIGKLKFNWKKSKDSVNVLKLKTLHLKKNLKHILKIF